MSRRSSARRREERRRARRSGPECDRCGAPLGASAWRCPACGYWLAKGTKAVAPIVAVALIAVAIGAGYYALHPGGDETEQPAPQDEYDRQVSVRAYQFGFAPDTVTVKRGERVRLTITNSDVVHGIRVPDLGIQGKDVIVFTPQQAGEFAFYCNNYCGSGHGRMQGMLVVQP